MYITIKSTTEKGTEALKKLMANASMGVASRTVINTEPYTVQIIPKGLHRYAAVLRGNPYAISAVEGPMKNMMMDYGAVPKDYELNVVF